MTTRVKSSIYWYMYLPAYMDFRTMGIKYRLINLIYKAQHQNTIEPHHEKTCQAYAIYEQRRRGPVSASALSDQRLCCSLTGRHKTTN